MNSTSKRSTPDCVALHTKTDLKQLPLILEPISYVHDERFDDPNEVHEILESTADCVSNFDQQAPVIHGQEFLLPRTPLLTPKEEQALFLSMNCRRFLAEKRRRQAMARKPTMVDCRFIQRMLDEANVCRMKLATANQRLVVSIASSFASDRQALSDFIGEGNINLMKAIDLFNVGRGFRFSTYATYAIRRHLSRIQKREWNRKKRWSDEVQDPIIEEEQSEWIDQHPGKLVEKIMADLPEREQKILSMRFGLKDNVKEHTYEEIARRFGISKERVRQLIVRACSQAQVRYAKAYGFD